MANVILVEDTQFFRESISAYLREGKHKILATAADGMSAVNAYKKYLPQIMIIDAVLPEMSGFDACNKIVQYNNQANVIIYSAIAYDHFSSMAYFTGARDFLLKPFDKDTLLYTIDKIIAEEQHNLKLGAQKKAPPNKK